MNTSNLDPEIVTTLNLTCQKYRFDSIRFNDVVHDQSKKQFEIELVIRDPKTRKSLSYFAKSTSSKRHAKQLAAKRAFDDDFLKKLNADKSCPPAKRPVNRTGRSTNANKYNDHNQNKYRNPPANERNQSINHNQNKNQNSPAKERNPSVDHHQNKYPNSSANERNQSVDHHPNKYPPANDRNQSIDHHQNKNQNPSAGHRHPSIDHQNKGQNADDRNRSTYSTYDIRSNQSETMITSSTRPPTDKGCSSSNHDANINSSSDPNPNASCNQLANPIYELYLTSKTFENRIEIAFAESTKSGEHIVVKLKYDKVSSSGIQTVVLYF